ncbi:hypothetical protein ACIBL8_45655 [Streptomyces sp. NPDC050523]|uniref:hypothetical protein n=1 Tax=Streptomyces sp. NPDC050523 TaxID=3365622 RepID=UPI0037AD243E
MHDRSGVRTMSLTRVVLATGRPVDLAEVRFTSTYGGLDGYPCKPFNDLVIRGLLSATERSFPTVPVHLVPPPREYPHHFPGAYGPVEILPPVACVGSFRSTPLHPAHDPALSYSALTVIWFQRTTRMPHECDAEASLRGVDWDGLARDHEV